VALFTEIANIGLYQLQSQITNGLNTGNGWKTLYSLPIHINFNSIQLASLTI